jgi:hypothetical protein
MFGVSGEESVMHPLDNTRRDTFTNSLPMTQVRGVQNWWIFGYIRSGEEGTILVWYLDLGLGDCDSAGSLDRKETLPWFIDK